MTPQQGNWNRMHEIAEAGNWTATSCAELCQLNQQAKDNGWWDNWEYGCGVYQDHCKVQYGDCGGCEVA